MERGKVIEWLLDESQPSVRYKCLKELLDKPPDDPEVVNTYSLISTKGWVPSILELKNLEGCVESNNTFYNPKYISMIWKLLVLADLGLTKDNSYMKTSCELFIKEYSKPDGGFGSPEWEGSHFCTTGNLARALIQAGYSENTFVLKALDWLIEHQKEDGGWNCFESSSGTLDCWEALSAFNAMSKSSWSRRIKRSVERGVEFYLEKQLYLEGDVYDPWLRFHYPVHYYYDLLLGLDLVTSLGYGDDNRLVNAINILYKKRNSDGNWNLDSNHPDLPEGIYYKLSPPVYPLVLEEDGMPSKLITLAALKVLKCVNNN